jgi:G-patch domain
VTESFPFLFAPLPFAEDRSYRMILLFSPFPPLTTTEFHAPPHHHTMRRRPMQSGAWVSSNKDRRHLKTLDPQNQTWVKDENKFGQKLMQKMGWKEGKGLGKHEKGRTTALAATQKSDASGMFAAVYTHTHTHSLTHSHTVHTTHMRTRGVLMLDRRLFFLVCCLSLADSCVSAPWFVHYLLRYALPPERAVGIGAEGERSSDNWIQNNIAFDDVLTRLAAVHSRCCRDHVVCVVCDGEREEV